MIFAKFSAVKMEHLKFLHDGRRVMFFWSMYVCMCESARIYSFGAACSLHVLMDFEVRGVATCNIVLHGVRVMVF